MKVKPVCTAVTSSFTTTPSLFQDAKYPITSQTTTIGTLIKHYRTLNNMGEMPVKLMLDDEVLEDSQQIQDTDLEDEDMVSASWQILLYINIRN